MDITKKSVFVNREKEMSALLKFFEQCAETNEGKCVFIEGEAGIGKTRLVSEFAKRTEERSTFIRGACVYGESSEPYLPFIESLGSYIQKQEDHVSMGFMGMGGSMSAEMGVAALGLMTTAEGAPTVGGKDMQDKKGVLFESFSRAASSLASQKPLVLFIDDFQWADAGSVQLMGYLVRNLVSVPVLMCVAYRPEEMEEKGSDSASLLMRSMSEEGKASTLSLERLNREHISEMTQSILGRKDLPKQFLDMLFRESEGNPFFVEEVIKALVSEGVIDPGSPIWDTVSLSHISIPRSIKDVISRRILRLEEESLRVLRYASIIGNRFSFEVLRAVVELDEEDLVGHIDSLMDNNLIHEDTSGEEEIFVFDHIQIITVVYDGMSRSRLRVMHRKVGEALEQHFRDNLGDVVYALAKHFFVGRVPDKTVTYSILAAKKAMSSFAMDEALNYYSMALNVINRFPENQDFQLYKGDVLFNTGWVENMLGEWDSALVHYEGSIDINKGFGNNRRVADAYREMGHLYLEKNRWDDADRYYAMALKIYEELGDYYGIADTYRGHSKVDWRLGKFDEAVEHINLCIENAIRVGNDSLIGSSYIDLGNVYYSKGESAVAKEHYKKAIGILERSSNYPEVARAYNNVGEAYKEEMDFSKALESYYKSLEYADKGSDIRTKGYALGNIGETYAKTGELDKAEEYTKEALDIFVRLDERYVIASIYMNYGIVYRKKEDWVQAETSFKRAMEMMKALNIQYDLGVIYTEYAKMLVDKGDKDAGITMLKQALVLFEEIGAKSHVDRTTELLDSVR